jgi:rubredoxin
MNLYYNGLTLAIAFATCNIDILRKKLYNRTEDNSERELYILGAEKRQYADGVVNTYKRRHQMWQCQGNNCGYIYTDKKGDRKGKIPPDTRFEDLPEDWKCPVCGAGKKFFKEVNE